MLSTQLYVMRVARPHLYNTESGGEGQEKSHPVVSRGGSLGKDAASWRRNLRQRQGTRFVKKTQAQTFSAGGLDNGARIVYYSTERRRKATHTQSLNTMKTLVRIILYDGPFKVYQMSSHLPKAKAVQIAYDQAAVLGLTVTHHSAVTK